MSTLDLVKKAYKAWESKDIEALRAILHKDYRGKLPGGMEIIGIEGAKECLDACPFNTRSEHEEYITEGDRIVRIWDMVADGPDGFRVRMAELNVVKDGKVILNEAFFDSKAFPESAQEEFEKHKQKAAEQKHPATTGKGKQ